MSKTALSRLEEEVIRRLNVARIGRCQIRYVILYDLTEFLSNFVFRDCCVKINKNKFCHFNKFNKAFAADGSAEPLVYVEDVGSNGTCFRGSMTTICYLLESIAKSPANRSGLQANTGMKVQEILETLQKHELEKDVVSPGGEGQYNKFQRRRKELDVQARVYKGKTVESIPPILKVAARTTVATPKAERLVKAQKEVLGHEGEDYFNLTAFINSMNINLEDEQLNKLRKRIYGFVKGIVRDEGVDCFAYEFDVMSNKDSKFRDIIVEKSILGRVTSFARTKLQELNAGLDNYFKLAESYATKIEDPFGLDPQYNDSTVA